MDTQFGAIDGNAIIIQLALKQDHLVKEENRVSALEQFDWYRLVRVLQLPLRLIGCAWSYRPGVGRRVAPIVRLDHLFNLLRRVLSGALPVARVRDLEHVLVRLVDGVESVGGGEANRPARGHVCDGDEVVAKNHLGHGDADIVGEGVDGAGFGDGQLAR